MDLFTAQTRVRLLAMALSLSVASVGSHVPTANAEPAPTPNVPASPAAVVSSGASSSAPRGSTGNESAWITEGQSRTVTLCPGTRFIVAPNSHVVRLPNIAVSLGGKEFAKSAYSVELVRGRLDIDIDPSIRPIYGLAVRAPRKAAAVAKAGQSTIAVTSDDVTLANRKGREMMTGVGERWRPLAVGRAVTVSRAAADGIQRLLLSAPVASIDLPLTLALGNSSIAPSLSWSEVKESRGYLVRLYRRVDRQISLVREQQLTERSLSFEHLEAGHYRATVASVDVSNLESAESAPIDFSVVEAVLPPGAEVRDHTIRIPAGDRLRFSDASGLELCYSRKEADFVAAPPSIGLNQGQALFVRLRLKGHDQETSFTLEPQELLPTIDMGSAFASWPGPPISIGITLLNTDGTPASTSTTVNASVTINGLPAAVQWKRTEGKLVGLVDKPSGPGPWIVRLVLSDARGRVIGRDFLEVAQAGTPASGTPRKP